MESLAGRVAIVSGGARGIRRGIATVLRAEGANIVVADVDDTAAQQTAADLSASGSHAIAIGADVTRKQDAEDMAALAVGRWGRIDVLAANAGIYPHTSR